MGAEEAKEAKEAKEANEDRISNAVDCSILIFKGSKPCYAAFLKIDFSGIKGKGIISSQRGIGFISDILIQYIHSK